MDIVSEVELWHKRARPAPTEKNFNVQLGCHAEEFVEMLESLQFFDDKGKAADIGRTVVALSALANALKYGVMSAIASDRKGFLDSLADQIVTAVGAGHCAHMDVPQALDRVNVSNWSKFDNQGQPIVDANGKVTKGPNYRAPNLEELY